MLIPFEIRRIKNPDNSTSLIAVISVEEAVKEGNTKELLSDLQKKYYDLIKNCKKQISLIQKDRINKGDPRLHWDLGNMLFSFVDSCEQMGFYFANFAPTLSRDTGISERYLTYHVQFRKGYPNQDLVHNNIKWWGYQELLDISNNVTRKKCENKLINGEIKTRTELRKYKKNLR